MEDTTAVARHAKITIGALIIGGLMRITPNRHLHLLCVEFIGVFNFRVEVSVSNCGDTNTGSSRPAVRETLVDRQFEGVWSTMSVGCELGPSTKCSHKDAGTRERETPTPCVNTQVQREREKTNKGQQKETQIKRLQQHLDERVRRRTGRSLTSNRHDVSVKCV